MPRNISSTARRAIYAPQTGEVFIILLTINHADLAQPIRVTSDAIATTSRGEIFIPYPFEIALPDETSDSIPKASIRVDNIDRGIVEAIRTITSQPTVVLEIVLGSDPDTVEAGPYTRKLEDAEFDYTVVSGNLGGNPILDMACPPDRITPDTHRALFRNL